MLFLQLPPVHSPSTGNLAQTIFTPTSFYTRHLLHQTPFTPNTFHTRHLLHQTPFTPDNFQTKHLLHQAPFTPDTFYTRQLSHQTPFTPTKLLHQPAFTPDTFTPTSFYTRHLLHQTRFTPNTFYTRHLLHQTPFTPGTFYTRHLLHQTPFTPNTFYTNRLLHQTTWQFYFSLVYLFWTPLQQNSGHYIPYITCFFPQPEKPKSRVPFSFQKIGNSFQWFTCSRLLYSKTPATTSHSHSQKTSKVESLFLSKNWQLYFSVVYLFLTPLQQNSGHYIPFPQPENLKSKVPFFSKNWQLYFSVVYLFWTRFTSSGPLLPCYFCSSRPSTARPPDHPPDNFYTNQLLHQTPLHQPAFTPDTFYTRHLLHQTPFTPGTFYTRHLLHQTTFTPNTFYTRHLLHQTPFTPGTFYTRHLLHQTTLTPNAFYTNQTFTPTKLLHQPAFTPDTFYTRHLLHQTPFTPGTFYTRHLLHQTPFTPNAFYTNRLLHQTTWQFYFSLVYLFWTPLQQNSGHYIPYITCFFPQPEKPKSRVPFFSKKLATLLFRGLPLLDPSTAKLRPLHPIPTASTTSRSHSQKTSKVESLFFSKNWQLYFSVVYLFLAPLQQNSGHYIPFPQPAPHPIPTARKPQK